MTVRLRVGLVPLVHLHQTLASLWVEGVGLHPGHGINGLADLGEVGAAVRAAAEVPLKTTPLSAREPSFEVVGDQFYCLLANKIPPPRLHRPHPPSRSSMAWRARARWSRTCWLASLIPSTVHTSTLFSHSKSRSVTSQRWRVGSSAMAAPTTEAMAFKFKIRPPKPKEPFA
jgi:hypothetical protein